jgi:hypothetical protein
VFRNEFQAATAKIRRFDDLTSATWQEALEEDENEVREESENPEILAQKLDRKLVKKTLIALMSVFGKFSNLKAVHNSTEIYDLFNKVIVSKRYN